jgi:hypothetical protein
MTEIKSNKDRDWDEILPRGDHELVALNVLIPRKMSENIGQITGMLQTKSPRLRQTKQATVQQLLEQAIIEFFEEMKRQDREPIVEAEESASNEIAEDINVIDIIKKQRAKGIDPVEYAKFSNPAPTGYNPRR